MLPPLLSLLLLPMQSLMLPWNRHAPDMTAFMRPACSASSPLPAAKSGVVVSTAAAMASSARGVQLPRTQRKGVGVTMTAF